VMVGDRTGNGGLRWCYLPKSMAFHPGQGLPYRLRAQAPWSSSSTVEEMRDR
jgi:hypothetical protein